ncbi:hypothetical protein HID58_025292 [Brassica napus]|uniref:Uncharacterized protein n=1 Tax=Brassica napus TaxID=3708 RepID=A0ABQ8CL99_BRANA|nr:hypothetical protein HID58_025292 [Brassica napus]
MASACSLEIFIFRLVGSRTEERIARHANLIRVSLSLTVLRWSILITEATVTTSTFPNNEGQYGFSVIVSLIFIFDLGGNVPHGSPVTIANSRSENLIGCPANLNHTSCFFFTFSCLDIMYLANLPENDGLSPMSIIFPKDDARIESISSSSSPLIIFFYRSR